MEKTRLFLSIKDGLKWNIIYDGYGLGISDGWTVDRPIIYDDRRVAYDSPERLPKYVKTAFERMAKAGTIENRMNWEEVEA